MINFNFYKSCLISLLFVSVFASVSTQAMQIERPFPEGIKRGKLSTTALAELVIDGKLRHPSAAIRIYSEDNLIVTQASVYVRDAVIYYLQNDFGEIEKIWILSREEASKPIPKRL